MSDHQFEKNVRKQLEELKFHPDAAVWTSVEKRISGRKRKRRGILWIPILLLLTASGYWMLQSIQKNNTPGVNETTIAPDNQPSAPSTSAPSTAAPDAGTATAQRKITGSSTTPESEPAGDQTSGIAAGKSTSVNKSSLKKSVSGISTPAQSQAPVANIPARGRTGRSAVPPALVISQSATPVDKNRISPGSATTKKEEVSLQTTALKTNIAGVRPPIPVIIHPAIISDSSVAIAVLKQYDDPFANSVATMLIPSSHVPIPPVEKRKTKWQWGINLQGGFSNVTEGGLFDLTEKSLVQDVASNSFSSPLPANANAVLSRPSDVRPATSISAGGFVTKPVSKRINLSAGINYTLLQTSIQVGQLTQASRVVMNARGMMDVEAYYRSGTQVKYYNQYHFMEVPVQASVRLNKRRQYPFNLNAGMVVGRLISSNALHFDGASTVYYEDNSLFNKTQFGFSGGLSIGLLQSTAHPVTIGPFFHYRATNLMKHDVSGERHLISYGIDIKLLMKK